MQQQKLPLPLRFPRLGLCDSTVGCGQILTIPQGQEAEED